MNILIVEDNPDTASLLRTGLQGANYHPTVARNGEEALRLLQGAKFDLLLLDVELPGQDGLSLLKTIRQGKTSTPVIILTGTHTVTRDRVQGLNLGADDYMTKPFSFPELLARIRAIDRRASQGHLQLKVGDLEIDVPTRTVKRGGRVIELTQKEYVLLEYLARKEGQVVTRNQIAVDVWQQPHRATPLDNVIDVHVSKLRDKIDEGFNKKLIHTIWGQGYTLKA